MKKNLILKNKAEINTLFENGKSFSDGIVMLRFSDSDSNKFLFAVSSKKFKRAVDRNKIKRLMKESVTDVKFSNKKLAIVYIGNTIPTFEIINNSVNKLLLKLN